jgi:NAD(P)-dependent dehydrogenase (short-subunit alcohol dehydrogenase family)
VENSVNSTTNVLITGAARRIGGAIAEDLAAHGFGVAIHCNHSSDEADLLAATIGGRGGRAAVIQADLADLDATARLFGEAETAIGPISILINNASLFEDDSIRDFEWDLWDRHFDVHLKAPALLARSLDAALPAGSEGLVVNIIDQRVWRPTPRYFSYTLSKSALWMATQTMAQALAPKVRVNAIGPGPTLANSRQQPEDFQAQVDGLILKQGPALAEFGATVRYLWQARSVTGQMIALDGGQHLAWQTPDVTGMKE